MSNHVRNQMANYLFKKRQGQDQGEFSCWAAYCWKILTYAPSMAVHNCSYKSINKSYNSINKSKILSCCQMWTPLTQNMSLININYLMYELLQTSSNLHKTLLFKASGNIAWNCKNANEVSCLMEVTQKSDRELTFRTVRSILQKEIPLQI